MQNKPELSQQLRVNQSLVMTQAMQQAFTVLSLPQIELEEWLLNEVTANPLIEIAVRNKPSIVDGYKEPAVDPDIDALEIACSFNETEKPIAYYLFHNVDSCGVLQESLDTIAAKFRTNKSCIASIIERLIHLMPPGTIATSLKESLLLKLLKNSKGQALIDNHYQDLLDQKYHKIIHSMNISFEELQKLLETALFKECKQQPSQTAIPDLSYFDGVCTLAAADMPEIALKQEYLENSDDPFVRKYLASAKWLARILDKRKRLLSLLAVAVESGEHTKTPKELAEAFNCHESTLFRLLANKFIATEEGIFPLSQFFATRKQKKQTIDDQIKELIKQETAPLTDEELAQKVVPKLSRRTIAKYRKRLGIPSSPFRKK